MTLDYVVHLVYLLGLIAVGVFAFSPRATDVKFCLFACGVWIVGIFAVNTAFHNRGSVWMREPMRRFTYELKSRKGDRLGKHHQIIAPEEVERLPQLFDHQNDPVALQIDFRLEPSGQVTQARVVRSSGNPVLDSATAAAIRGWRFGPLPAGYSQQRAETVSVVIENRYEFMRQSRALRWTLALFGLCWIATVVLLPGRLSNDEAIQGIVRRAITVAGFLAGTGWMVIWRLAPDLYRFDLPAKQGGMMVISFAVLWLAALGAALPAFSRGLVEHSSKIVGLGVVLLLLTRFFGTDLNTGHRLWLPTPVGPFQTVEFVKLLLLFFVAGTAYAAAHAAPVEFEDRVSVARLRPWSERYRGLIGGFILVFAALVLMSDFGPLLLLALLLLALLWAQGHPRPAALGFVGLLVLLTLSYAIGVPARWHDRVAMWRQPWVATQVDSAQLAEGRENIARGIWSISSGGLLGLGLGQGAPDDVEAVESDFVFSAIAEELGWLGSASVLGLILVLALTGLQLARRRDDALAKTLAGGLGLLMAIQAGLTIGGNLGLWPLTGITLPFLSYGRSSLLISFLALGLLIGLAPKGGPQPAERPLPLADRIGTAQHRLQWAICLVFALFATRAAALQWPGLRDRAMIQQHHRADATLLSNPRLDGRNRIVSTHIIRGSILDRDGTVLASTTPRGRQYNNGPAISPLIGLVEKGQMVGLERALHDSLIGQWDAPERRLLLPRITGQRRGFDVKLTIDQKLQKQAYELLDTGGYRGCIVGIEPGSGQLLFAASSPAPLGLGQWVAGYDANKPGAPPFAYRKWYEPGSTFKTFTTAAALTSGAATHASVFACRNGYFPPGGGEINDHHHAAHGTIGLSRAMAQSCNQTFAQLGVRLGWKPFWEYTTQAGLGTTWPLLPPEWRPGAASFWPEVASGQLTHRDEKPNDWSADEALARSAIGQEDVRATPLYLATWTAAIANGGKLLPPSLVTTVSDQSGRVVTTAPATKAIEVMRPATARRLTRMMERVVTQGTGTPAQVAGVRIAAKTGTPETGKNLQGNNAVFIAFAPIDKPKIAIAIVLEGIGGGGANAGPLAAEMIRTICK